jgi:hypothetical protein
MYRKSLVDNKHVGHESSGSSQVDNASSPVAQQGGTEDFGRGKDAWNRFLKSKQGLGLNRQQLKDLYHKQLRFHRARSVGGREAYDKAIRSAGNGGAASVARKGANVRDMPHSSWNRFLKANKGLGFNRPQLQALYQRSASGRTRLDLSSLKKSDASTHARQSSSEVGAIKGFSSASSRACCQEGRRGGGRGKGLSDPRLLR